MEKGGLLFGFICWQLNVDCRYKQQSHFWMLNHLRMVSWVRWHCPWDTRLEIQTLEVWGRTRYLSVTEAPHNIEFYKGTGKKYICFLQTEETGKQTPNSNMKGSGAHHYPRSPAQSICSFAHLHHHRYLLWCSTNILTPTTILGNIG